MCCYFDCILSVVLVVTDGFSLVGLLVDACALFQCVLWFYCCLLVWFEHIGARLILPLLGPLELELVASVNIRGEYLLNLKGLIVSGL